jgi:hypothetical protein
MAFEPKQDNLRGSRSDPFLRRLGHLQTSRLAQNALAGLHLHDALPKVTIVEGEGQLFKKPRVRGDSWTDHEKKASHWLSVAALEGDGVLQKAQRYQTLWYVQDNRPPRRRDRDSITMATNPWESRAMSNSSRNLRSKLLGRSKRATADRRVDSMHLPGTL